MKLCNFLLLFGVIFISGCDSSTESIDTKKSWVQREKWELNTPNIIDSNPNSEYNRYSHGK